MDFNFTNNSKEQDGLNNQISRYSYDSRLTESSGSLLKFSLAVILLGSVLFTLVTFLYSSYLNRQIEASKQILSDSNTLLGELPISDMKSFSDRVKFVRDQIENHPYPLTSFRLLESSVENGVYFTNFSLTELQNTGTYNLDLTGSSPNYRSIIQQIDTLRSEPYNKFVRDLEVVSLTPDKTGVITFSLRMKMNIKGVMSSEVDQAIQTYNSAEEDILRQKAGQEVNKAIEINETERSSVEGQNGGKLINKGDQINQLVHQQ